MRNIDRVITIGKTKARVIAKFRSSELTAPLNVFIDDEKCHIMGNLSGFNYSNLTADFYCDKKKSSRRNISLLLSAIYAMEVVAREIGVKNFNVKTHSIFAKLVSILGYKKNHLKGDRYEISKDYEHTKLENPSTILKYQLKN